jgi:LytS/YehU family sensor histidine kinase
MHRDVEAADTMLTRLSDLLRSTMKHRGENEITLREELALVDNYIEIMRVRFGDRVTITRNVEPAALDVLVPQFILQPLVENAFDHGVARTPGASSIVIDAIRSNGNLELSVSDDGRGDASNGDGSKNGIGLTNTRLRLEQLYGSAQSMSLEKMPDSGTRVAIAVPWRLTRVA